MPLCGGLMGLIINWGGCKMELTLKIGDKLLCESPYHGLSINEVVRLTKTTAILDDNTAIQNPIGSYIKAKGSSGYGSPSYSVLDDAGKQRFERQQSIRKISKADWKNVPTKVIKEILNLLSC